MSMLAEKRVFPVPSPSFELLFIMGSYVNLGVQEKLRDVYCHYFKVKFIIFIASLLIFLSEPCALSYR
jgi:hypothetical protein